MSRWILLAFLGSTLAAEFSYDQCNKTHGPSAWASPCNPNQQGGTPINLCNGQNFPSSYTKTLVASAAWSAARTMDIFNNGHTIQVNIQTSDTNVPTTNVGNLNDVVGRSGDVTNQSPDWKLAQLHLHWGRLNKVDEGSEHYIEGNRFAAEAHFVHFNPLVGATFQEAVNAQKPNSLLVVGVMLEVGNTDTATIKTIADETATATRNATAMKNQVTLSDLFNGTGEYYSYGGGLTTPNCFEWVTWIVMKTPKKVLLSTLNLIKNTAVTNPPAGTSAMSKFQIQAEAGLIAVYGNYRPLQARGGRTVYSSNGVTPACTNPTEPNFGCSSAFMVNPSIATPLAAILSIVLLSIWN